MSFVFYKQGYFQKKLSLFTYNSKSTLFRYLISSALLPLQKANDVILLLPFTTLVLRVFD